MIEYPWLLPAIFMIVGGSLLYLLSRSNSNQEKAAADSGKPKEIELTDRFCMGGYLGGFPNSATPAPLVFCAVTDGSLIFIRGKKGEELGRIPRDAIDNVTAGDKSQIAEQLTAQEKSYLGKISASNKDKHGYLVLSWENSSGPKHKTVFELYEQSFADSTAQELKKWMKHKGSHAIPQ